MEITRYINDQLLKQFKESDITLKNLISFSQYYSGSGWNIPIKIIIPDKED